MLLMSDLLLLVDCLADGSLRVTQSPIYVHDIAGLDVHRKCASELLMYLHTASCTTSLTLRTPSAHDKLLWKSLLEQRVQAMGGRIKLYGGSDNVKTSQIL